MHSGIRIPPAIIRDIRKSNSLTMHQLQQRIGVSRATISRYESGHCLPSASVAFQLFALAQNDSHRGAIIDALGSKAAPLLTPEIVSHIESADKFENNLRRPGFDTPRLRLFQKFCIEIADTGEPPKWLISAMEFWLLAREAGVR